MSSEIGGNVQIKKRLVEETEIEWEVTDFVSFMDNFFLYKSPNFCFANNSWFFELYQKNSLDPNSLAVYLGCPNSVRNYSVVYSFGLKKHDGSVEHLNTSVMPGNKDYSYPWKFIKHADVHARKSELLPSGNFTIMCRLQSEAVSSMAAKTTHAQKICVLKKLDTLSDNFKNLFVNKPSCDVTLHVMDKEYKAHRAVLMARSSVFSAMFEHETSEKQTGILTISDCDPESFEEFLEFLYCGKLHKLSFHSALHLYETSNKYDVRELKAFCLESLMQSSSVENVCDIAIIADKYEEANLMSAAQHFFHENLDEIIDTPKWDSLVENNYSLSKKLLKGMSSKLKAVR